jgi:hypothetical protein
MPWASSTVYLADTPDARAVLLADAVVIDHVFAFSVGGLTSAPQIVKGDGRLLAVRSPGRARDKGLLPDALDWAPLDGLLAPRLAPLRAALEGDNSRIALPDPALRWMEDLAARVNAPVAWYQAEADHGEPDAELAWVIDVGGPDAAVDIRFERTPSLYARVRRKLVRIGAEDRVRDPLAMALAHLGVVLDSPWFEPHAPHYQWAGRRVTG